MTKPATVMALVVASLLGAATLAGCDGGASDRAAAIERGVANLTGVTGALETELGRGAHPAVGEYGEKLEGAWSAFEDQVKDAYPDLYEQIEEHLDPLIAGTRVDEPDPKILAELNNRLKKSLAALGRKAGGG